VLQCARPAGPTRPYEPARPPLVRAFTAAACTAIFTAVVLFHFPPHSRVACTCRIQFRHFRLSCLSAAAVRRFPYVVRFLSPPLVSCSTEPVRAQLPRAAQGQTRLSLAPRSPLPSCTDHTAIAAVITDTACTAISTAVVLLLFPLSAQSCCLYLSSPVSPSFSLLHLRCCSSSLSLCRSLLVASACVLLH
jgi:hypothetical protein